MTFAHELILAAGLLCLLAIAAGLASARLGTPLLLAFIAVGMLAGEDGPGGIPFDDFSAAYLIGSLALAVILFQGGLATGRDMLRQALGPAIALATAGVAISAGVTGAAVMWLLDMGWREALLLGAATAPTDAAAVTVMLGMSGARVPSRVVAALEVESGLNDPMSVFLTVGLVELITAHAPLGVTDALLLFGREMAGGAALGLLGGWIMLRLFRWLALPEQGFPVLAVGCVLALFGGAQVLGTSGFLATYIAGYLIGNYDHPGGRHVAGFFEALGWLAQISLFLMLGLLVTPHMLGPAILPALAAAAALAFLARPLGVFACLLPFRWRLREAAFVSWVGLRGAVPIYLTIIPLLAGVRSGRALFDVVFVVVVASVAVQGPTIGPVARWLRLSADPDGSG